MGKANSAHTATAADSTEHVGPGKMTDTTNGASRSSTQGCKRQKQMLRFLKREHHIGRTGRRGKSANQPAQKGPARARPPPSPPTPPQR